MQTLNIAVLTSDTPERFSVNLDPTTGNVEVQVSPVNKNEMVALNANVTLWQGSLCFVGQSLSAGNASAYLTSLGVDVFRVSIQGPIVNFITPNISEAFLQRLRLNHRINASCVGNPCEREGSERRRREKSFA